MTAMILPLNGWAAQKLQKSFKADVEFFKAFENEEIIGADVNVQCTASKRGQDILLDLAMEGTVTVVCDRCLDNLDLPVSVSAALVSRTEEGGEESADGREVILHEVTDKEIDLSQIVYDYICLSLPMQRVHPEGKCNPEVVRHLGRTIEVPDSVEDDAANPFSVLKGLFNGK
jgi:uncharacterized metal-binding protein YceD (DUF177 family)